MMRPLNTYDLSDPKEDIYIEAKSQVSTQLYFITPAEERNTGTTIIINANGESGLWLKLSRFAIPIATSLIIVSTSFLS